MVESWNITIPALTKKEERKAYVYLPVDYDEDERYPVMYMFDGHNLLTTKKRPTVKAGGLRITSTIRVRRLSSPL